VAAPTLEILEQLLVRHEQYEFEYDLEGTIGTLIDIPRYELPTLGWRIEGKEAVTELYKRMLTGAEWRAMWADKRVHAWGGSTLCREAFLYFNTADGDRVTGQYFAAFEVEPDSGLIVGERLYMDAAFAEAMAEDLGPDFGDIPGVSRLVDRARP
jgi:hypothetical protein